MIITDKYLIYDSNIFYLYDETPLMNGILDMEVLSEQPYFQGDQDQKRHASGPFLMSGSSEFICVHQIGSNYLYNMRIVQLPDSESVTLASDYQKKCDFSTFLEDGSILMRVAHRFCLFDSRGNFIDGSLKAGTGSC